MNRDDEAPPGHVPLMPSTQPRRSSPRLSGLAVMAMALAAIPCCPLVSGAGSAMGIAALRRIQRSGGMLTGARLARSAIFIGAAVTVLSTIVFMSLGRSIESTNQRIMVGHIQTTINSAIDGQLLEARRPWGVSPEQQPSPQDIHNFAAQIDGRYGRLQRISIASTTIGGSMLNQKQDVAGIFVFERRELTGSASFNISTSPTQIWPQFTLRSLVIDDPQQGDLRLPAPASAGPSP